MFFSRLFSFRGIFVGGVIFGILFLEVWIVLWALVIALWIVGWLLIAAWDLADPRPGVSRLQVYERRSRWEFAHKHKRFPLIFTDPEVKRARLAKARAARS